MKDQIKNIIKKHPRVYDFFNLRRSISDELESWIDNYSRLKIGELSFIQVGANDGLRWDPIRRFVVRDKWKGVFVEPLTPVFEMLKSNYAYINSGQLIFKNCVVSNSDHELVTFWTFSEEFLEKFNVEDQLYYLRKSSIQKEQVLKALEDENQSARHAKKIEIPCHSLKFIIEECFSTNDIDLIFIDAEGHDDQVINTIDFLECRPKAIIYESHSLSSRKPTLEKDLVELGYKVSDFGGDSIALLD